MGTASGLHPDDARLIQGLTADQEPGVLLGVDVVGDHADLVVVAQALAQGVQQGGLAGADGTADAYAEG